jgi:hypothetical protein
MSAHTIGSRAARIPWIALAAAVFALGFVHRDAHGTNTYSIASQFDTPTRITYRVSCPPGAAPFDALLITASWDDSPANFSAAELPSGWAIDPVFDDHRIRIAGPALDCPAPADGYVFTIDYSGTMGPGCGTATIRSGGSDVCQRTVAAWTGLVDCDFAPPTSSLPVVIPIVGMVQGGARPDPFGLASITLRDMFNNPVPNTAIMLDFTGCCDVRLCGAYSGGQPLSCSNGVVTGYTNTSGVFSFTVIGAARDPGNLTPCGGCSYPGPGLNAVVVRHKKGELGRTSFLCLDQNGGTGAPSSNGTSGADISAIILLFGDVSTGGPYRARGDINMDEHISGADVGALIGHFGRLAGIGGVGCTQAYGATPACP